jgi:acyl carrier protein
MVPSAYVLLPALPLTANGKLDRAALPEPDADALPQRPYVAPRNELEEQLCVMWEQVLGVAPVGVQHNFFELGGHSLTATQLVSRVRERFAVQLPLRSLFDDPTVENLASAINNLQTQDAKPQGGIVSMKRERRQVSLSASGEVQVLTKDLSGQT